MYATRTQDGSLTLYSERYRQTFHSVRGALAEAQHVFLEGSGVGRRLREGLRQGRPCRVLEVGFGSGLNGWLTADLACETEVPLEILALEHELLPSEMVRALEYARHLRHPELLERYFAFREALPEAVPADRYRLELAGKVTLELLIGEAEDQALPETWADAVYHDAFSPDANLELWDERFLSALYRTLNPGGALVTYSVKGEVRRALQRLGFVVEKLPGPPGGKREMLLARKP